MNIFARMAAVFPANVIRKFDEQITYADIKAEARSYVGRWFMLAITLAFAGCLLHEIFYGFNIIISIIIFAAVFGVLMAVSYIRISLAADSRARKIEAVLPDALQIMSANIRAGMTIDKALWLCARPELGAFEKELRRMAAETIGGESVSRALVNASGRIKSPLFNRASMLIVQGLEFGGEIANLLIEIARDLRMQQGLQKEIGAATAMYALFIVFAAVLAAPLLFSISTFYVESSSQMWLEQASSLSSSSYSGRIGHIGLSKPLLTGEEVRLFALTCISISTFFGALTIGLVRHGHAKRGLKYSILFLATGLSVYIVGLTVVRSMFGTMMV